MSRRRSKTGPAASAHNQPPLDFVVFDAEALALTSISDLFQSEGFEAGYSYLVSDGRHQTITANTSMMTPGIK
jgi:hypothetical protein